MATLPPIVQIFLNIMRLPRPQKREGDRWSVLHCIRQCQGTHCNWPQYFQLTLPEISKYVLGQVVTDHFSGLGSAIGLVCV